MRLIATLGFTLLATTAVVAQEEPPIDQGKLYLGSPQACEIAEGGQLPENDFQNLRFADNAIQFSEEAFCSFYQVLSNEWRSELIVTALCEFGGYRFADTLLISPMGEGAITVQLQSEKDSAALYNATQEISAENPAIEAGAVEFFKCSLDGFPSP